MAAPRPATTPAPPGIARGARGPIAAAAPPRLAKGARGAHRTAEAGVAAVDRALAVLAAFLPGAGEPDRDRSLADLAGRTGLYKSTILRLLASLERANFVQRGPAGRWRLGPAAVALAAAYRRSTRIGEVVGPVIADLAARAQESASFYVRDGEARLCLVRVDAPRSVRDAVREGDRLPLDRGAAGRVLLAFAAGPVAAREELVFVSRGERTPETAGIAAPVFDQAGALVGAVSLSGPLHRFDEAAVARMRRAVAEAAGRLTRLFGGDPAPFLTLTETAEAA